MHRIDKEADPASLFKRRKMNLYSGEYFNREIREGIFMIGCRYNEKTMDPSWNAMEDRFEFGTPTGNSWLIIGKNSSLVIDSCAPVKGFRKYLEDLAGMKVDLLLSHAHFDHTFMMSEFDKVYMHKNDRCFFDGRFGFPAYRDLPEDIAYIDEGDDIELGDRRLKVFHIKGHSDGSVMLLDEKAKVLFSGDSIARRILLFDIDEDKLSSYFQKIAAMKREPFSCICSAHDRVPLHKEYINFLFDRITKIADVTEKRILYKDMPPFYSFKEGDEKTETFINCSVLCEYRDAMVSIVKKTRGYQDDQ